LRFIREIAVPAFLAFLGWIFSQSLAKQSAELQESLAKQSTELQESLARQSAELQRATTQQSVAKDYVGIAATILERPKQEGADDLREWASKLLVRYSPEPFSPNAQAQLEWLGTGPETGPSREIPTTVSLGNYWIARTPSPDRKRIALMRGIWMKPINRTTVEVYDTSIGSSVGVFEAGAQGGGSPAVVWSQDGSKLLVGWNYPPDTATVTAIDVAQVKSLGSYKTEPPGGQIETPVFSSDGRSVIIKRVDGKTKEWQLP